MFLSHEFMRHAQIIDHQAARLVLEDLIHPGNSLH